jgi:hypothetical protein
VHPIRRAITVFGVLLPLLALTALANGPTAGATTAATVAPPHCVVRDLPVRLTDPGPADNRIWGQLCYRGDRQPDAVQLLVAGGTYDHHYWDMPGVGPRYSYVDAATLAGYATFNVDRVGTGHSSYPPSAELSIAAEALSLHDVVTALRSGAVDGHRFARVEWVGHSMGSMIGDYEVATYHDVNAFLITGLLHGQNLDEAAATAGDTIPATDDPKFAHSGLDAGYVTTLAGTRGISFYHPSTTDSRVLAADERTKTVLAFPAKTTEISHLLFDPPSVAITQKITVPVIIIEGQYDLVYCGPVLRPGRPPADRGDPEHRSQPGHGHHRAADRRRDAHLVQVGRAPLTIASTMWEKTRQQSA